MVARPSSAASPNDASAGWRKYDRNPVMGGKYGTCFDISVLQDGGKYRMWLSWRPRQVVQQVLQARVEALQALLAQLDLLALLELQVPLAQQELLVLLELQGTLNYRLLARLCQGQALQARLAQLDPLAILAQQETTGATGATGFYLYLQGLTGPTGVTGATGATGTG